MVSVAADSQVAGPGDLDPVVGEADGKGPRCRIGLVALPRSRGCRCEMSTPREGLQLFQHWHRLAGHSSNDLFYGVFRRAVTAGRAHLVDHVRRHHIDLPLGEPRHRMAQRPCDRELGRRVDHTVGNQTTEQRQCRNVVVGEHGDSGVDRKSERHPDSTRRFRRYPDPTGDLFQRVLRRTAQQHRLQLRRYDADPGIRSVVGIRFRVHVLSTTRCASWKRVGVLCQDR